MTTTTEELKTIDDGFLNNAVASVRGSEYQLQKILGLMAVGDTLFIEDINVELNSIDDFKQFACDKYYFGLLDFDDLLRRWRND